ncbi:MAG TPA: YeeE/YedE thiosulfate transporter family protein [Flavobacteriales bacterium]|nr:YeeE/YedE thiosulfate transporter family protein [Flavobacteriales bacterium]
MEHTFQHTPSAQELADLKARELDAICVNESELKHPWWHNLKYSAWGILFGIVFVKAEIISWFRIQEMFRFESFHMYGVIGTAVMVGLVSVLIIRRTKARTMHGEEIHIPNKEFNKGQIYGGLMFGLGWAITGACPGPLFAQVGAGFGVIIVTFVSAVAGTWVYGLIREKLPH